MSPNPQTHSGKRSKNRALLWVLLSAVAIFYGVSWIRTGDALRKGEPVSRFPVDHATKQ